MIVVMTGVGTVCGLAIVGTYLLTRPVIAEARAARLRAAVLQVIPGSVDVHSFELTAERIVALDAGKRVAPGNRPVYGAYDASGALVGVAVPAEGQGFQDTIALLYGYSPTTGRLTGLLILDSRETPGLGSRIETDATFRSRFPGLSVPLRPDGQGLLKPPRPVSAGRRQAEHEIDAISGATISSRAVVHILGASLEKAIPRIQAQRSVLESRGRK